jgi:hypothetical protein
VTHPGRVPPNDALCLPRLGEVDPRVCAARRAFEEPAETRTGDPRLQGRIVEQLMR